VFECLQNRVGDKRSRDFQQLRVGPSKGIEVQMVIYVPGQNRKADTPPQQQDLADHCACKAELFNARTLLANGTQTNRVGGVYLFAASNLQLDGVLADPVEQKKPLR
jgi:hypothetical protein